MISIMMQQKKSAYSLHSKIGTDFQSSPLDLHSMIFFQGFFLDCFRSMILVKLFEQWELLGLNKNLFVCLELKET